MHGRHGHVGYGVSVLCVFATALHQSVLGASLTLARGAWYPLAAERAQGAGLEPLGEQQLARLLMWVPSGVLFSILGLALFSAWIGDIEHRETSKLARARRESPRVYEWACLAQTPWPARRSGAETARFLAGARLARSQARGRRRSAEEAAWRTTSEG